MKTHPAVIAAATALLVLCGTARADHHAELIAAADGIIAKLNARDAAGVIAYYGDQRMVFGTDSPMLTIPGKNPAPLQAFFDSVDFYSWALTNREDRVWGSTGVTAGHVVITVKLKGDPITRTMNFRLTTTWAKIDGKWKIVAGHNSWHPSGKPAF